MCLCVWGKNRQSPLWILSKICSYFAAYAARFAGIFSRLLAAPPPPLQLLFLLVGMTRLIFTRCISIHCCFGLFLDGLNLFGITPIGQNLMTNQHTLRKYDRIQSKLNVNRPSWSSVMRKLIISNAYIWFYLDRSGRLWLRLTKS